MLTPTRSVLVRGLIAALALSTIALASPATQAHEGSSPTSTASGTCNSFARFDLPGRPGQYVEVPTRNGDPRCTLRRGDRGSAVIVLQHSLRECNDAYFLNEDGFGEETERAIRQVQEANGQDPADGVYDDMTAVAMLHAGRSNSGGLPPMSECNRIPMDK